MSPSPSAWRDMSLSDDPSKGSSSLLARLFAVLKRRSSRIPLLVGLSALSFLFYLYYFEAPYPSHRRPPWLDSSSVFYDHHRPPFPRPPQAPSDDDRHPSRPSHSVVWKSRAEDVKKAFLHAYGGYEKFASPKDELLPVTDGSTDNFNGWGVTMVDSLDTMLLMDLNDIFERSVSLVKEIDFKRNIYTYAPFFETTIRYLGGFLGAYALSNEPVMLRKADELGRAMLPVFNSSSSGFPVYSVNPATGASSAGYTGWFAEIASCQLEYKYLAHLTGEKEFYDAANNIMKSIYLANTTHLDGLFPTLWSIQDGTPANAQVSIGAFADSAYEYLLKQWLLTAKTEKESLELYLRTVNGIINNMMYLSPVRNTLYVTDIVVNDRQESIYDANTKQTTVRHTIERTPSRKFEHLSCFLPGLLALGVHTLSPPPRGAAEHRHGKLNNNKEQWMMDDKTRELHLWAASGLAYSCYLMYHDQETGLGPDEVSFVSAYEMAVRAAKEEEERASREGHKHSSTSSGNSGATTTEGDRPFFEPQRYKVAKDGQPLVYNQTEMDHELLWVNALEKWRRNGKVGNPPGLSLVEGAAVGSKERDYNFLRTDYLLRPETIESMYILYRVTGDERWRERGWEVFQSIEKETKTDSGYATIKNVADSPGLKQNSMPSYFLAETLKYLYLLFKDEDLVPLDQWVFNTEAHPFRVFEWSTFQSKKFGIGKS